MKTLWLRGGPPRRTRRDGRVVLSIGALAVATSPGFAAGTATGRVEAAPITDVAFHDGADLPVEALAFFPVVVLDAERAPSDAVRALARAGSHPAARLAMQPAGTPADLVARARRIAVAGYEGALLEVAPGSTAAPGAKAVADAVAALRTIWPEGPLLLAADPRLATQAAPQLSGVVVSGSVARASELAAFARRELSAGRTVPLPVVDVESVPAGRRSDARRLAEKVSHAGLVP